jgi:hypothetical protein
MSPDSTELWQEGALIHSDFLIRDGEFNLKAIEEYLSGACLLLCAKSFRSKLLTKACSHLQPLDASPGFHPLDE